ncbi:MAG: hypothetical protein WC495_02085 [Patescibacteria group bacterium]
MSETVVWTLLFVFAVAIFGTAAYASFSAAPWLPLRTRDHRRVLKHMKNRVGTLLELGAGDARLMVQVVQHTKLKAIGYEISLLPYLAGKLRLKITQAYHSAELLFKDFFREDFSQADVVYCFLTPVAMEKLKPKFEKELKKGTRVISYSFKVPGWTPTIEDRDEDGIPVFVYDR